MLRGKRGVCKLGPTYRVVALLSSTSLIHGGDAALFEPGSLTVDATLAPSETFGRDGQGGHEGYGLAEEAEDEDWARDELHDCSEWAEERLNRWQ